MQASLATTTLSFFDCTQIVSNTSRTMSNYQHQLNVMIADTLEKLQDLNPDLYSLHYAELYTERRNWDVAKLHQLEQDIIENAK